MANRYLRIWPEDAKRAARRWSAPDGRTTRTRSIMACIPGIFRGALDVRARDINEEMKLAAARAIAYCVSDEELTAEYIMPMAFDHKVIRAVADARSRRRRAIRAWPASERRNHAWKERDAGGWNAWKSRKNARRHGMKKQSRLFLPPYRTRYRTACAASGTGVLQGVPAGV